VALSDVVADGDGDVLVAAVGVGTGGSVSVGSGSGSSGPPAGSDRRAAGDAVAVDDRPDQAREVRGEYSAPVSDAEVDGRGGAVPIAPAPAGAAAGGGGGAAPGSAKLQPAVTAKGRPRATMPRKSGFGESRVSRTP
jgi:hypothetical protein